MVSQQQCVMPAVMYIFNFHQNYTREYVPDLIPCMVDTTSLKGTTELAAPKHLCACFHTLPAQSVLVQVLLLNVYQLARHVCSSHALSNMLTLFCHSHMLFSLLCY